VVWRHESAGVTTHTWITRVRTASIPQRTTIRTSFNVVLLVVAFCALGLAGYQVETGQWHATPVLSGSMRPAMQPGDVVVTQRVAISDLRVRDVLVFHPPNEGDRMMVHRIVKLTVKGGTTSITTWGDANPVADPTVSSLAGTNAYRVARVIPLFGYPAMWLQNGRRGLLSIALGVILLIASAVTVLRPDKHPNPPGSAESTDNPGDSLDKPLEAAESTETVTDRQAVPVSSASKNNP
jgi:signal peptidase